MADSLIGAAGNDRLDGGLGYDTLTGGAGNDTFSVGSGADSITDLGGSDILTIASGAIANATVTAAWTATSASSNAGIATLTTAGLAVNLAAATAFALNSSDQRRRSPTGAPSNRPTTASTNCKLPVAGIGVELVVDMEPRHQINVRGLSHLPEANNPRGSLPAYEA